MSITKNFFNSANGIAFIYDITKKKSFEGIKNWIKQIKESVSPRVCVALVGNKIDREEEREIPKEEGEKLGSELNYPFYESSAKEGININECFDTLIKQIDINYANSPINTGNNLKNKTKPKGRCC